METLSKSRALDGPRTKMDLDRLGEALRHRRHEQGWSLTDLSQMSGVSTAFISDLENGKGGRPNVEYLFLLTASLGTTIDALIEKTVPSWQRPTDLVQTTADIRVPASLGEFARAEGLTDDEIGMLARVNYRGKRPKTLAGWRAIYEAIRLASR
jgi:transcriptional regulator with XRE-family HTH domain